MMSLCWFPDRSTISVFSKRSIIVFLGIPLDSPRTLSSCWVMWLIASALGTWAMCFLGTTMVGASLILGKKLEAIFRV